MNKIDEIIDRVVEVEGGYVNDPEDNGGETNFGITVGVARNEGYLGPMSEMPVQIAKEIYHRRYVTKPGFDKIVEVDFSIGVEMIDTGVNMSPNRPGEFLQRWLNGFNSANKYPDLFVDGHCGPITVDALTKFLNWRGLSGRVVMLRALNGLQAERYLTIAEKNRTQRKFLYGWVLNRVEM